MQDDARKFNIVFQSSQVIFVGGRIWITCHIEIVPGATISRTVKSMIARSGAPSSLRRPETGQRLPVQRKKTWIKEGIQ